jgi:hypothetical protein
VARGPATFKQRDLTAAVKALVANGYEVARVEIHKDGKIAVVTGGPPEASPVADEFIDWKTTHADKA